MDAARYLPQIPPEVDHTLCSTRSASYEYLRGLLCRRSITAIVACARPRGWRSLARSCCRAWSRFQPVTSTTWSRIRPLSFFPALAYAVAYFFVTSTRADNDKPSLRTPHRCRPRPVAGGNNVRHGPDYAGT